MTEPTQTELQSSTNDALITTASQLVRLIRHSGRWQQCIPEVVATVGQSLGASRCYLVERLHSSGQEVVLRRHTQWNDSTVSIPEPPDWETLSLPSGAICDLDWTDVLATGIPVSHFSRAHSSILTFLESREVRSLIVAPVFADGPWWGCIVVEDCTHERRWTPDESNTLHLVADTLGAEIEHQQLEDERNRVSAIIENSEDAIIEKTMEGILTSWNPAAERIYGYSPEEMIGESITRIIPAALHSEFLDIMNRLRAGEHIEHHETTRIRKDGSEVPVSLSISPTHDHDGSVSGAVTIARDISDRKRSELELQASEERLRLALEAGNIGAWDWDLRSNDVVWSTNMERLHGMAPGTFAGTFGAFTASVYPDDQARVIEAIQKSLESGEPYQLEYRSRRADGSYQWLAAHGSAVNDESGRTQRMTGVCFDVTARKQIQSTQFALLAQLQRAHAETEAERTRLRQLFQHAPAMMALLEGPDHVFTLANDHYLQSIGNRDVVGKPVAEALPEVVDQGLIGLLDRVYQTGETESRSELPVLIDLNGDGRLDRRFFSFAYQPSMNSQGEVVGILVHAVDLTETVRARQRVEELAARTASERDRLQQIIDVLPEGVSITDEHGAFILANAAALKIWGQPAPGGGYHQYGVFECHHPDGTLYEPEDLPLSRSILVGEEILGEQLSIRNADTGELIPVLVNSVPLRDNEGSILGAVAVFQDITPLKAFEHQKDEFLQAVTHDLRNPLTSILGNVQLLRRVSERGKDRTESVISSLESATKRAVALVDEILDLTRLQMGRQLELTRTPVNLVELVERLAVQHQATTTAHQVIVEAESAELTGYWDEVRLERVIANLLGNAIMYSPDGGRVVARVHREGSGKDEIAVVSIEDQGLGIPEEDMPLLFDRFSRGSNVRDHFRGTGLGLAGAKAIVEAHGGEVFAASVEGDGSTFTVRLPLAGGQANVG